MDATGLHCQHWPWTRPRSASPASRSPPQGRSKGRPYLSPECFRCPARVPEVLVHQRERLRLELGGARPEAISQVSCNPHIQQVVACEVLEGIPRGTARDTKGPGDARRVVPVIPLLDTEGEDFQIFERTKVRDGKAREGHIHGAIGMLTADAGLRYPVLTLC